MGREFHFDFEKIFQESHFQIKWLNLHNFERINQFSNKKKSSCTKHYNQ